MHKYKAGDHFVKGAALTRTAGLYGAYTILKAACQGKKAMEPVSQLVVALKLLMSSSRPLKPLVVTEYPAAVALPGLGRADRRGSRGACRIDQHRHDLSYPGANHLGRCVRHRYGPPPLLVSCHPISYPAAGVGKRVARGREARLRTRRSGYRRGAEHVRLPDEMLSEKQPSR